jgi:tetratricopeptide (TPR) repeat protein
MDYQTYAYLQMAQDRAARAVLERVPAVAAQFDATATAGGAAPPLAGFYALAAIPARYALERGAWQEAADLGVPASGTPFTIAIAHFARALGAARSGRPAAAAEDIARLAVLRDQLRTQDVYWSEQIDIQWRVATAWAAFAAGRKTEGVETLRAAAAIEDATDKSAVTPGPLAPARESLGDMLLEAGDAAAAVQAYAASIAKEPGRFRGAYGAARAAEANGDAPAAHRYYETVLELSRNADSTRPEIERARAFVRRSQ